MKKINRSVLEPKALDINHELENLKFNDWKIPKENLFRIPTMNHFGNMFTKFDPIVHRWLESITENPKQVLFEVGGAYGNVAIAALEKGVEKYYLNDYEEKHLKIFLSQLKEQKKEHILSSLELILGRCPDDVKLRDNSLDGILVNKVLHFFTPNNIDVFIEWIRKGLKLGGFVYILTLSPFYKGHEEIMTGYAERKKEGIRFPGWCPSCEKMDIRKVFDPSVRPASLLYMEMSTLKELFQSHGFQVVEEFDLATINEKNPEWGPGKDMAGIIAKKTF